ncbi:MAG: hypothetical protein HYX78_01950 [Armatimonadetes bacterium]|nr:hypothetical protein [Armatimonadota bacterium]
MAVPWYEWDNIRNRLIVFGRAMQGVAPYRVVIEPDRSRCPSGYCNFTARRIAVNPDIFPAPAAEQYQLTKALLVHEAGHRRFTDPERVPELVKRVANILEDERVERRMSEEFAGVRWLVQKLSDRFYLDSKPIDETSDCPGEVVAYFLQLRWARRAGQPVKGGLSARNQAIWKKVEPLVYESWEADTAEVVYRNSEKIVELLGIHELDIAPWVTDLMDRLGHIEGERIAGDEAEKVCGRPLGSSTATSDSPVEPEPFDGEVLPNDRREGSGYEAIEPKPYIQLEEKVTPLVQELIDELSWEESPCRLEPAERGGRFSMRDYLKDMNRPFLTEEAGPKAPPTLVLKVIVDHSTSLNHNSAGTSRIESVAGAVMALHLVCTELRIPHEIMVTPQNLRIADSAVGERGKALVAGLVPARCGYEDMGRAIQTHAVPMTLRSESIRLVLCLTDGACNDAELGKRVCRELRGKVEVIGVLLDPDETTEGYVTDMFGEDRIVCCNSDELPWKLGNILRAIRGA